MLVWNRFDEGFFGVGGGRVGGVWWPVRGRCRLASVPPSYADAGPDEDPGSKPRQHLVFSVAEQCFYLAARKVRFKAVIKTKIWHNTFIRRCSLSQEGSFVEKIKNLRPCFLPRQTAEVGEIYSEHKLKFMKIVSLFSQQILFFQTDVRMNLELRRRWVGWELSFEKETIVGTFQGLSAEF